MTPTGPQLAVRALETPGPAAAIKLLSSDYAVQFILADIPFFAVGLFAFGVFTFFLVLRRVDRLVLCLHFSVFIAFVAGILDLIQILSRGKDVTSDGFNISSVSGLIIAREVTLALSFGLRNLFLWGFAGIRPPGELQARDGRFHSGCWERWGWFGICLRWTLLTAIIASTVLQIIYRVLSALRQASPLTATEGVIQIVISAVLLLKLFMNTYLTGFSSFDPLPRWKTVFHYSPVMVGLLFNFGIAIGNVIQFLFTDTVMGRFLQAVELYILILYVLISAFFVVRDDPNPSPAIGRSSSFRGLPAVAQSDAGFHITPPTISTPDLASAYQRRGAAEESPKSEQEKSEKRHSPSYTRASSFSRMSSWITSRRISGRTAPPGGADADMDRLWNQDRAERGVTRLGTFNGVDLEVAVSRESFDQSPMEPKQSAKYTDPAFTAVLANAENLQENMGDSSFLPSIRPSPSPLTVPSRAHSRLSGGELARSVTPASEPTTDSPVYGLDGPVRPPPRRPQPINEEERPSLELPRARVNDSARSSGISGLLRQQEELDRSIAALRLFRASAVTSSRTSGISGENPLSAAGSEFSLSNFPVPPWGRSSSASLPTINRQIVVPDDEQGPSSPQSPPNSAPSHELLPPPVIPAAVAEHSRNASVPYSDDGDVLTTIPTRGYREFSGGTQYEITSFIGGLTQPDGRFTDSLTSGNSSGETGVVSPSNIAANRQESVVNGSQLRNLVLTPETVGQRSQRRISMMSNPPTQPLPPRPQVIPPDPAPRIAPGAGRGVFASNSALPRNNRPVGLPPRPRLGMAGIRVMSPLNERPSPIDEYEHPRPAPVPGGKSKSRAS